jgi:hypothetical protein
MEMNTCPYLNAKARVDRLVADEARASDEGRRHDVDRIEAMLDDALPLMRGAVPATLASARTKLEDALTRLDGWEHLTYEGPDLDRRRPDEAEFEAVYIYGAIVAGIRAIDSGEASAIPALDAALYVCERSTFPGCRPTDELASVLTALRQFKLDQQAADADTPAYA